MVTSTLFISGKFVATFTMGETERKVTAMVGADGTISTTTGEPRISGTFGLEDCTASGMWMRSTDLSGTWNVEKH